MLVNHSYPLLFFLSAMVASPPSDLLSPFFPPPCFATRPASDFDSVDSRSNPPLVYEVPLEAKEVFPLSSSPSWSHAPV